MSGAYCVACTSGGRDPNQRSAINSRWAILPQLGDRDLGGRHDAEARSDFLGEECELKELGASGGVKIVKIGRFENRCRRERTGRKRDEEFSGLDAVFHTEACAFDKDDFGVVEKAVEDGGGNGAVAVED